MANRTTRATLRSWRSFWAVMGALAVVCFLGAGTVLAKGKKKKRAAGGGGTTHAQLAAEPSGGAKGRTSVTRRHTPRAHAATKHAEAEPSEAAYCSSAYQKALDEQRSGHLREAKELLGVCAKAACGDFLAHECTKLYTLTDSDIPSVVPVVTDGSGRPLSLVEVRMDGDLLTSKLDGEPLAVNPGNHEFSFSTNQGTFAKRTVLIMQGQHNRKIAVRR